MKSRYLLAILGIWAWAGLAAPVLLAQETPVPDSGGDICDVSESSGSPGQGESSGAVACARSQANVITLIHVQEAVEDIVANRLLGPNACGPSGCPEPAGLRSADPAAVLGYLSGPAGYTISPAADVTMAQPVRRWNTWANGKFSWTETGQDSDSPTDGPLVNLTGGIDYKFGDRVVVGLIASYENSDLDTKGLAPASTKTDGIGGGAYIGVTLTNHLVFSGLVTGVTIDTDLDSPGATAELNSDRIQASGGVTGYWYFGQTRWSPSATLAWSKEWQDDYVDSAGFLGTDQNFETGIATLGSQLGHTFALTGGTSIEPWAGALLDWTFVNTVETDGFDTLRQDDTVDLRLQAGFNWNLAANAQLAVTGEVAGLLLEATDTYAGEVNLAIQF